MDPETLDVDELRDAVRSVLEAECDLRTLRKAIADPRDHHRRFWPKALELGWVGLGVPEEFGGLGGAPPHVAVLCEELGGHLAPGPLMTTLVAAQLISSVGSAEQRATLLPRIAKGELRIALPGAADAAGLRVAGSADEGWTLRGSIDHVLEAQNAQMAIVPATDAASHRRLIVLDLTGGHVEIGPRAAHDATRQLASLFVREQKISDGDFLGAVEASGVGVLEKLGGLAIACDSIGGAWKIFGRTVEYMKVRRQFGRPIGSFQALKHRAADLYILLETATGLTRQASQAAASSDTTDNILLAHAKANACECYLTVAEEAVQLHGGIGFTWEHECHLFLKRAQLNAHLFGTADHHRDKIAGLMPSAA